MAGSFSTNIHSTHPKMPYKSISGSSCHFPANRSMLSCGQESWMPPLCSLERSPNRTTENRTILSPSFLLSSLTSTFQNSLSTIISKFIDAPPLHPSVDPNQVFTGNFAPVDELDPTYCEVAQGELPRCLNGVYIRNGPNPQYIPNGPLHSFEADGMLHSLKLSGGQANYCSRYVKTYKYMLEKEAGFPIFPNLLSGLYSLQDILGFLTFVWRIICGHVNPMRGFGLANTSITFFANKLLALGESDLPYAIALTREGDIETLGRWDFNRKPFATMTAHPKVDKDTKEAFAFQCNFLFAPSITYFYFNKDGVKQKDVPLLSINQPTLIHDFGITKRFAIFAEMQLVVEPRKAMLGRGMLVYYEPKKVPRIGVIPRYATSESRMVWFQAPGLNAMHVINAWENGDDEIVLVAPNVLNLETAFQKMEKAICSLEKVTICMRTGKVSRKTLSERNLEMGTINDSYIGKKNRYVYLGIIEKVPKMSGLVKMDMEKECEVSRRVYGPGCFGSGEPLFVSRDENDAMADEDDGFLLNFVHDEKSGESNFIVMDAKSPNLDIVATVKLPRRVPYGFHGLFVSEESL